MIYNIHGNSITIKNIPRDVPGLNVKNLFSNSNYKPITLPDEGPIDLNSKAVFDQTFYNILINAE